MTKLHGTVSTGLVLAWLGWVGLGDAEIEKRVIAYPSDGEG